jgi:RNA polymerase primary sigma factor
MPRLARFKIGVIEDLLRQLEYAPEETRRRQMDNSEKLIADINPLQNYPEDFIIFRITGYRRDKGDESMTLVGEALLPDLVNLVQVLSESLELEPDQGQRRAITMDQVAQRLRVSSKTVQRYRKLGLVCHFITFEDGAKKLACFEDALQRFMSGHAPRLEKAASFTRIDPALEQHIIEQARALHQNNRLTLNEAAILLSKEHGRAHETIRVLLRRHDRQSPQPIFADPGPLTDRQITLLHRAWLRGVEPARMAERFGKTKPTIHRAINRRRAELLAQLDLKWVHLPTFDLEDSEHVILSAPAVTTNLGIPGDSCDAVALIQQAAGAGTVDIDLEHALLAGYNMLKNRAAEHRSALEEPPGTEDLDAIETWLRWASMVRKRLILLGLPATLRRIEQNLGRPLLSLPADQIAAMIVRGLHIVGGAIETLDSSRGQRLERIAGFAMERELAKFELRSPPAARAAARHPAGSIKIAEASWALQPWDAWLGLRADLGPLVPQLADRMRLVMTLRFGLAGSRPLSVIELASAMQARPLGIVRQLQQAMREVRALARSKK